MSQPCVLNVKRTKFYPVDLDGKRIIDDPHPREGDLAWKYRHERGLAYINGKHLLAHTCYLAFEMVPPKSETDVAHRQRAA